MYFCQTRHTNFYTACGMLMITPAWISLHPINHQCFSTHLLGATFSPLLVQTRMVRCSLARSFLTAITQSPVHIDPMLMISTSIFFSFDTLSCFSVPLVHTPSNRWSNKKFTCTVPNTFHFNITFQHLGWFLWSTFYIFHLKSWDHWFQRSLTTWHMNHYLRCGHTNSWADKKETGFGFWGVE